MSHVSAEAFTGHRIVKAFGAEDRETAKFERASDHYYRTTMKVTSALNVLPPLMEFIGGIAFATALWYGSESIAARRLTTGEFVAFITALFMMYGPAKKLSRVNADLQQARAAGERIFEILETHSEVREVAERRAAAEVCTDPSSSATSASPTPAGRPALRLVRRSFSEGGSFSGGGRDASRGDVDGSRRPDARDRRTERRRQDDACQSDSAVLRRDGR